jgi:uncharacterized protein (TIRG00374 family)
MLGKIRVLKNVEDYRSKALRDAVLMRRTFRRYFGAHAGAFVAGILSNGVLYFAQVVLLWAVFAALGAPIPFLRGVASIALLLFLIVFMPTPGSAGLGEAVFLLLFRGVVPTYILGVAVLIWRVYFQYLSSAIGALFSSKLFSDLMGARREAA